MLKSLTVSNYALIEKVDIPFSKGFSVITGETGAGKSILLGALGLILGQRADATVLRDKEQKCVVEAMFEIGGYQLEDFLSRNDLDFEPNTVVRREVLPAGKSRAFINDTPVNITLLRDFTSKLIDIHSQHQTLLLGENHFQLNVVDTIAKSLEAKTNYQIVYKQYRDLNAKLSSFIAENDKQKSDFDYLQFQYNQLADAKLQEGEQEQKEQYLQELTHASEIKNALLFTVEQLKGEQRPLLGALKDTQNQIAKVASYLHDGGEILKRIETVYVDLKDLADDLEHRAENMDYDASEIESIQARLGVIYELQQKHRLSSVDELLRLQDDLKSKINRIANFDDEIASLRAEIQNTKLSLQNGASKLTQIRQGSFAIIEQSLLSRLNDLGMPSAKFVVNCTPKSDFSADGLDDITFLFSANKSTSPAELEKVASGGEMSRLMLCIKALLSSAKGLPTLLLDEIDTGVSGEIADKMASIMADMGQYMQVVSITHLPQIAGRGQMHYLVSKVDNGHYNTSIIELLNKEQRVTEIAKMLSGSSLTDAAISNARELLRQ